MERLSMFLDTRTVAWRDELSRYMAQRVELESQVKVCGEQIEQRRGALLAIEEVKKYATARWKSEPVEEGKKDEG